MFKRGDIITDNNAEPVYGPNLNQYRYYYKVTDIRIVKTANNMSGHQVRIGLHKTHSPFAELGEDLGFCNSHQFKIVSPVYTCHTLTKIFKDV